ncbi:MAG: TIGR02594 family protein [Pseudomonadota bacterium]
MRLTKADVFKMQRALLAKGFDPGPIDGVMGPLTDKALVAFKRSIGYRARPYYGRLTRAALLGNVVDPVDPNKRPAGSPPWLVIARGYLGLQEYRGRRHNSTIVNFWKDLGLHFRDDETPWCAGFLNAVVKEAGYPIPPKYRAAALGWRWTGTGVRLKGPALGAIMDMTRPGRPGSGHITFVAGRTRSGKIAGLGGNQGNRVSINPYDEHARDARYYWPENYPIPDDIGMRHLPLVDSTGAALRNEA